MVDAEFNPEALARLARCLSFWQGEGFTFSSLPWGASTAATELTQPSDREAQPELVPGGMRLVASGEQSFLMLALQGQIPHGSRYVGWTPCFRREPVFDATHHLYFMKVELFAPAQSDSEGRELVKDFAWGSLRWMAGEHGQERGLKLVRVSDDQVDIELNGLEVGSYGMRRIAGRFFAYGTGCAEPRMTQALRRGSAN